MTYIEYDLPVCFAPYLINRDEPDDEVVYEAKKACADRNINPARCLDVGDEWIGRWKGQICTMAQFRFRVE